VPKGVALLFVAVAAFVVAFVRALSHGESVNAVIVGVIGGIALVLLGFAIYAWRRDSLE
jgi:uncharacterized YccA/Bax inhibitor family protein